MKGVGLPLNGRKERDEDLLLFKELHNREKDRLASLLQPVSDEFEPNAGNYSVYRIAYGKKGSGDEFFGENDKNDYDWLKTPPASPLFPSLEMEANAPQLVVQREIPIVQPLSRFAGNNAEAVKGSSGTPKFPYSKPKIPVISVTPLSKKSSFSSTESKSGQVTPTPVSQKMAHFSTLQKETETTGPDSKTKTRSRGGVSPCIQGFSNDMPPNLRTDRATSATRGRPEVSNLTVTQSIHQKPEPLRSRRHSCSPSVTRGRKESQGNFIAQKGKFQTVGNYNGNQLFGSRLVDKVMNVRKLSVEEREEKPKPQRTVNAGTTTSGFGRKVCKSSPDRFHKQMESKRDRINLHPFGYAHGRRSSARE